MIRQHTWNQFGFPSRHIVRSFAWLWCVWFSLSTLTACSPSASSPTMTPVDQSTPESTIRALYEAQHRGDIQLFESLLAPDDQWNQASLAGFKFVLQKGITFEATNITIDVVENDGKRARVRTHYHEITRYNGRIDLERESGSILTLDRIGDSWYFVGLGQQPSPPGWAQDEPSLTPGVP